MANMLLRDSLVRGPCLPNEGTPAFRRGGKVPRRALRILEETQLKYDENDPPPNVESHWANFLPEEELGME